MEPETERPRSIQAPWAARQATLASSPTGTQPLLATSASGRDARGAAGGAIVLVGLLAGAGVAFAGGLAWAAVVLATHYDIGFLAWFVGAATGLTVLWISRGPVGGLACVAAGLLAGAGLLLGKYVIFIHQVKQVLGTELAQHGISVGYLNTRMLSVFFHHFNTFVRPVYGLWFIAAFLAGFIAAAGGSTLPGVGASRARR